MDSIELFGVPANGKWYTYLQRDAAASDVAIRTADGVSYDIKIRESWGSEAVEAVVAEGVSADDVRYTAKSALNAAQSRCDAYRAAAQ